MPLENYIEKPKKSAGKAAIDAYKRSREAKAEKTKQTLQTFNQPLKDKKLLTDEEKAYLKDNAKRTNFDAFKENAPHIFQVHYELLQEKKDIVQADKQALEKSNKALQNVFNLSFV